MQIDFFGSIKNAFPGEDHVEYIEDCFKDLERPKFGWRVKVMLKEEEPCDLNIENPSLSTCGVNSNPASKKSDSGYLTDFAQNRQTGEGFRSVAPPDCRLVSIGSKHCYDGQFSFILSMLSQLNQRKF